MLDTQITTLHHHPRCPRAQAWDLGDVAPCECPPGWPRRERVAPSATEAGDTHGPIVRCRACGHNHPLIRGVVCEDCGEPVTPLARAGGAT